MTFQEAIDQGRRIVFHGHEPGYWLISFDDETEVRRIPNREVKAVTDRMRTPEEIEQDRRHEETTQVVNEEMQGRLSACNVARWVCIAAIALFVYGPFYAYRTHQPLGLWFFIPAICILAFLYRRNERERKVIVDFFKRRKEQEEEWG